MKRTSPTPAAPRAPRPRVTPNSRMTPEEKEAFIAQTEEFEGPSRREKRGPEPGSAPREPGVAPS